MSGHRFYGYGACGTCRKALAWLRSQSIPVEVLDITVTPPGPAELRQAFEQLGRGRLFNTSGASYRSLGAERVRSLSDEEALLALGADGKLIRRPFLVTADGAILIGFKEQEWSTTLA